MKDPYCKNLREKFYAIGREQGLDIKGDVVYVCTEGPRFETAQEIKMFKKIRWRCSRNDQCTRGSIG